MKNQILEVFNDEIMKKALSLVDQDALAKTLATQIEKALLKDIDFHLGGMDLAYILTEALQDDSAPVGKQFQKAMAGIAKKMTKALTE